MRVVIDTNVVVSALLFGGTPGKLIPLWRSGQIQPYVSGSIVDEYLRVLTYPKFDLAQNEVEYVLYEEILPYFELRSAASEPPVITADPSDDIFVHCALASGATIIISGDRHLLGLRRFQDIEILSVAQFLESI